MIDFEEKVKKNNNKELIDEYKNQLDEMEKIVLDVAIEQLGSSFSIEKSIGFLKWKEKNEK